MDAFRNWDIVSLVLSEPVEVPTPLINRACDVIDIGNNREVGRIFQLVYRKVESYLKPLVGCGFILIGIVGDDAHQQLVQRVFDAFFVEGGHAVALSIHSSSMVFVLTQCLLRK
jgi:hypothetical protein